VKQGVGLILFVLFCIGCSATGPVRTLPKGDNVISVSIGGPAVELGSSTIPIPYLTAGYFSGISDDITIGGNLHVLSAGFGNAAIDGSILYKIIKEDGLVPELTATGQLYFFSDLRQLNDTRLFPDIRITASYSKDKTLFFFGFDNTFEFSDPGYLITPLLGVSYQFSHGFGLQFEGKWMAANINTAHGVFEGSGSISGNGNLGIFIGLQFGL
jgi:hypothetical protein